MALIMGALSLFTFASGPLDFTLKDIDGKDVDLAKTFKGKVVLVVNVASKCGLTPQYEKLEKLYQTYKDKGLVVLGFPANEFGAQEPGTNAEIKEFCTSKYKVTFPMFAKIVVKGEGIHPLYKHLTDQQTDAKFAGEIKWNFTKFLIGRDGQIAARFEPKVEPQAKEVTDA
ncbi:MAG: glutathione peroxidase, partial [Planctomycetota bacterium]